uniref:RDD family protein n=1 Tax=Dysgonomonas sp. TaxID=1891233 RepID=UPI0039E48553
MKIRRFAAFFIDFASILFPGAIISLFMNEHPLAIIIVFSLIFSLILNKDILDGQSLGKRVLQLKVIKKKEQSTPSRLICCIRNIFLWPIDLFLILFTGKKLGDYITQTEVVTKTNATEAVTRNVITRSILFIIITVFIISLILYFTVYNSRSYRLLYI